MELFSLFGKKPASKDIAKDRLKLVLIHDRSNVSPELLEMMRNEIIKVISNYIEIDDQELDIQITKTQSDEDGSVVPALVANIPIKKMRKIV